MRKSIIFMSICVAAGAIAAPRVAPAAVITVTNPGFEDTTGLTPSSGNFNNDNNYDVTTNPFSGWTKYRGGLQETTADSVGPINPAPADIGTPTEQQTTPGGKMALYVTCHDPNNVVVLQTTGHTITGMDASFTLSIDVGKSIADYGGHKVALYADNGSTKTIIKQLLYYTPFTFGTEFANYTGGVVDDSANAPASKTWITRTLSLSQSDVTPYIGQNIGIALSAEFGGSNNITWYDTVSLSNELLPEPSSLGIAASGATLFLRRRRRHCAE
jgi:hypothetical protein